VGGTPGVAPDGVLARQKLTEIVDMDIVELLRRTVELETFSYLREVWTRAGWSPGVIEFVLDLAGVVIVSTFCLLIVILLIWLERKLIARMQDRIGPNRVGGKYGLLQTVADVLKLLTKEDIRPAGADLFTYNLAPLLIVMTAILMWAVMPFAPGVIGVDLNIGLFYVLAISSVSVVCLLLAGWSSNNKYALLGAFRAVAQLVSYEVPMILSLLVPILLARSMSMQTIITEQTIPYILVVPLAALIFMISALAETNRSPFDLLEAESEIVAGFHVEYSGMKFGMFFLAEFVSTLFMAALFAVAFWGGWRFYLLELITGLTGEVQTTQSLLVGGLNLGPLLGLAVFAVKTFVAYFFFVWMRGTVPRVRIDQMMDFNWKLMVPLSALLLAVVAIVDRVLPANAAAGVEFIAQLAGNLVVGLVTVEVLRRSGRRRRLAAEAGATPPADPDEQDAAQDAHGLPAAPAAAD
jgi:NADH-quinone oxidoreductase subunit H